MTDDVYIRHMQGAPRDCSMFKSNDVKEVNDIINCKQPGLGKSS